MPNPFLLNLWSCNPWQTEVDRQTALDIETLSFQSEYLPEETSPMPTAPDPNSAHSQDAIAGPGQLYDTLIADWPTVAPVIPAEEYVSLSDREAVKTLRDSFQPKKANLELECFNFAVYQMDIAGHGTTRNPTEDPRNWRILVERVTPEGKVDEFDALAAAEAVIYIKDALANGKPVLVGVRLNGFDERRNDDEKTPDVVEPTNHFVVIVGMDQDGSGHFFSFYDYNHPPAPADKLYLKPDMQIVSRDNERHLVQIRRNWGD